MKTLSLVKFLEFFIEIKLHRVRFIEKKFVRFNDYVLLFNPNVQMTIRMARSFYGDLANQKYTADVILIDEIILDDIAERYIAKPHLDKVLLGNYNYLGNIILIKSNIIKNKIFPEFNYELNLEILCGVIDENNISGDNLQKSYTHINLKKSLGFGRRIKKSKSMLKKIRIENDVTFVIPTGLKKDKTKINGDFLIERVIRNLIEIQNRNRCLIKVLIIINDDNASRTAINRVIQKYRIVNFRVIVYRGEFNFARKANLGLSEVLTNLAILLNDDVHDLSMKDVKNTIEWLYSDDKVAAVGALLTSNKKVISHLGITCINNVWDNFLEGTYLNRFNPMMIYPRQVSGVTAAYVGLDVKKFREIGGFDDNFMNQFDDVDLMLRFNQKGFKVIFDPNIKLIHQKTSTMKKTDIVDSLSYFNSKWGETKRDNFYTSLIESYYS